MKNRSGFIPKKYNFEPDDYECVSGCWNAVYTAANGLDYTIELKAHYPDMQTATMCSILCQEKDCRRDLAGPFKTLREAIEAMQTLLDNIEDAEENKRFHSAYKDALQKECPFKGAWDTVSSADSNSMVDGSRPASEIGYSRWDYDGYRWWSTYWNIHNALKTEIVRDEINHISEQFEKEFPDLSAVRDFCRNGFAEQKAEDTYDVFMVGEHCCFWFRFILRRRDYNLYLHIYSKEELKREGIQV